MSSSTLSKNLSLSSALKMDQEETDYKNRGIVSILDFDTEKEAKSTTPLRRTISADMSSRKWLEQNSLASRIKKVASLEELKVFMENDKDEPSFEDGQELERPDQTEVWNSIQEANIEKKQDIVDIWSCIISTQKNDHTSKNSESAPYVHPLVSRTASSLSEKSLEVCTESLGSETGSDGLSYSSSKTEDDKEEHANQDQQQKQENLSPNFDKEYLPTVKFHYADRKKVQPRSFPPPLPSLSRSGTGNSQASLHMRPRRDSGRLVLEAISVPSQNTFQAKRQDGRLVLNFAETNTDEEQEDELEEIFPDFDQDEGTEFESDEEEAEAEEETEMEKAGHVKEGKGNLDYVMETRAPKLSSGIMDVNRQLLIASKPMALVKRNPTWTIKLNEEIKPQEYEYNQTSIPLAKSLPPRHPASKLIPKPKLAAAAASLNAHVYSWHAEINLPVQEKSSRSLMVFKNIAANEHQNLQVLKGSNADRLVPLFNGCKESRRSLLFLERHCIATS